MMDAETSVWSPEEIETYQQAMMKYDKDFFLVSKQVIERLHVFVCLLDVTWWSYGFEFQPFHFT